MEDEDQAVILGVDDEPLNLFFFDELLKTKKIKCVMS